MNFIDDFDKMETIAREALIEMNEKYNLFTGDIQFTTGKYDAYDAFYFVIDDNTHSIKKRVYIELKIRDKVFETYLLETKKMNSLLKIRKDMFFTEEEATILYINFTPNQTIIYNIDNVKNLPTEKLIAEIDAPVNSKTDKIEKSVIMLKPTDGKQIQYILNERNIMNRLKINSVVKKMEKEIKGLNFMFEL